jgi:heme A synthase
MDGPGVLIQMIHRIGALVIGFILIASIIKVKKDNEDSPESDIFVKYMYHTGQLWLLNLLIGASYLIFAKAGDFPEWLSLLHLLGGISCFLVSLVCPFMIRLSSLSTNINSTEE